MGPEEIVRDLDAARWDAAFDAANRDCRVVVCQDLVRGFFPEVEEAALRITSLRLGLVMESTDLLAAWKQTAGVGLKPVAATG